MSATATAPSTFSTAAVPRLHDAIPEIFVRRDEIHASLLAAEADTLGWDCVNAIRLPKVNAAMVESDAYPKTFETTIQEGWTLSGTFGPWQLARGGSGAIVFLRAPLKSARMTFPATPDLDLTNARATIAIKLQYLPQPPAPPTDGAAPAIDEDKDGTEQFLASDTAQRSEDDPAVVLQSVDWGGSEPSHLQEALFKEALTIWFNANLDKFTYVFSVVNLNARAAQDEFQWLKPTYTSYAYFNGADDDQSYFGVLNLTSGNTPEGLTNQLPPSAIPAGADGSILISSDLFLRQMILPGLRKAFSRATESDFTVRDKGKIIENTKDITLDDIKVDLSTYTPVLQRFTLQVLGDEIQIDTETKVHVSPGIDVYITATEYYRITLVDKPDGGQTLDFVEAREARRNHRLETATWVIITDIIIGIVAAIVSTVAGKIIKTLARRIIAILIIALVAGLLAAIPTIIGEVMKGKAAEALPSIGNLVAEASGDVSWPASSGFTLTSAELNGSLQLGGNLNPVTG